MLIVVLFILSQLILLYIQFNFFSSFLDETVSEKEERGRVADEIPAPWFPTNPFYGTLPDGKRVELAKVRETCLGKL